MKNSSCRPSMRSARRPRRRASSTASCVRRRRRCRRFRNNSRAAWRWPPRAASRVRGRRRSSCRRCDRNGAARLRVRCSVTPGPLSATSMRAPCRSDVARTSTYPPLGENLIAFSTRLPIASNSSDASACSDGRCLASTVNRNVFFFRERRVQLVHALQGFGEIDGAESCTTPQILKFGDAQQRAESIEQRIHVDDAAFDRRRARIARRRLAVGLDTVARASRVSGVRRSCAMLSETPFTSPSRLSTLIEHSIDDAREHVQFVAPAGNRQARAEISAHYRLDRLFDGAHAAQRTAAQQITADHAWNQNQRQRPAERAARHRADAVGHAGVAREDENLAGIELGRHAESAIVAYAVESQHPLRKGTDFAVARQFFRNAIDVAGNVGAVCVEQSVHHDAAKIEFARRGQAGRQAIALDADEESRALLENVADDVIEILRGLPADRSDQHDAPHEEERTVDCDQPRCARTPAHVERFRCRRWKCVVGHQPASVRLVSIMYPHPRTVRMSDGPSPTSTLRRKRAMCTSITLVPGSK